ncbi:MAG: D-alanine--D-alanine ligase family protein [Eubacteriales bacterium]
MIKKTIVVLFGGQSSEHEVSCVSATTIIENINKDFYNILPVGITKKGEWFLYEGDMPNLKNGNWLQKSKPAFLAPDAIEQSLYIFDNNKYEKIKVDVVFPALHGLYGEDGTIQGLLELNKIPYVGCGVLASSVAMDKLYTKIIVDKIGIRQAKYIGLHKNEFKTDDIVSQIEKKFDYPVFVKPSNAGSSVGITKAYNEDDLIKGIKKAFAHDRKVLVEETINGREVECAILGGESPKASGVGEIISAADFYDYDSKYNNEESRTILSPDLPQDIINQIQEYAVKIFKGLSGYGLSRVDFFVEKDTNEIVFNEINTLPGFTAISMYPMLWEEKGMSKQQLVKKLIKLAFNRN